MAGHDWGALHAALETATGEWTRDELIALLRDFIREYVVERGLPTGTPTATTPDLSELDFAQLITWLKRNLSVPELALFEVDGDRVIVEADGGPRVLAVSSTSPTEQWPAADDQVETDAWPVSDFARDPEPRPARRPANAPAQKAKAEGQPANQSGDAPKLSRAFRNLEFE
ncbi:MAG: hypothetical protein KC620_11630 [Myxococcales bacterium]|nr:hypothetical protein [Myxococcales bacterium]